MNYIFDFATVTSAIAISVGLALWLEWLMLCGFMRLMPAPRLELKTAPSTVSSVTIERHTRAKAA